MLTSLSILGYMLFLIIESGLYIYLATIYLRRMHEYSWDSNVPAEKYILVALWVGALFYTVLTITNVHTITTMKSWEFIHHLITILNAAKRSVTMGVTVLLSSGRSLSTSLALCIVGYAATYVGISKFVTYRAHKDPYNSQVSIITYVWPTMMDLLIYGYSLYMLQRTIVTLELTNQTRKLDRYLWLRRLLILVTFILLLRQLLIFTDNTNGPAEAELDQAAFFFTLAGVGFLWRPSPANRDFENVVELQPAELEIQSPLFAIAEVHHENDEGSDHYQETTVR
jgi:hypothetical protein